MGTGISLLISSNVHHLIAGRYVIRYLIESGGMNRSDRLIAVPYYAPLVNIMHVCSNNYYIVYTLQFKKHC